MGRSDADLIRDALEAVYNARTDHDLEVNLSAAMVALNRLLAREQQTREALRELCADLDPWTDEGSPWWPMFQLAEQALAAGRQEAERIEAFDHEFVPGCDTEGL